MAVLLCQSAHILSVLCYLGHTQLPKFAYHKLFMQKVLTDIFTTLNLRPSFKVIPHDVRDESPPTSVVTCSSFRVVLLALVTFHLASLLCYVLFSS